MLDEIEPLLWEEWKIFVNNWPIGDRRADLRNALLATAIDCVVSGLVGAEPFLDPQSLMPFDDLGEDDSDDGWEDPVLTMAKLEALAQRCGQR